MRTYSFAAAAVSALAGAVLFASSVTADVDPIVIKVRIGSEPCATPTAINFIIGLALLL